ncbi:uncharacterized protein J4E84_005326 [Alternaria hordeiaustralica]|uniref:uncharacterized protein n=1 Tax=Alternaria hordeiaustralica TaxID=1187925 RepID=UPI0020C272D6|nr:uncharacterized protein J4E84_005326 [Alternaria hordeiaustralica]KAI4686955.1 hypothetical protein J4E84_005326 [Alternaria hordeiaustralica]
MAIRVIQDRGGENRFDERRKAYTASLESEVVQLRANEARLSQETKTLYSEVAFLKSLLTQNGIAIPDRSRVGLGQQEEGANVGSEKRIALTVGQEENKKKNRRKQIYVQQVPQQSLHTSASTGHALTVSACLFHHHPSPPGQRQFSPSTWEVPHASIDQLLALSSYVPLQDGEVTPVQAWDYIRRQEGFAGLEAYRWDGLKEKLVALVRCYGFGGVVEREAFENAVFEAFVVGRVF